MVITHFSPCEQKGLSQSLIYDNAPSCHTMILYSQSHQEQTSSRQMGKAMDVLSYLLQKQLSSSSFNFVKLWEDLSETETVSLKTFHLTEPDLKQVSSCNDLA